MKITKIETINFTQGIRVHAGAVSWLCDGLVGLGETYPAAEAAEVVIGTLLAEVLLGRDPRQIDRLWADMLLKVGYHGWAGSEMRAISAIDIALWDLLGKLTGQPVYQLLGGRSRDRIRTGSCGLKRCCRRTFRGGKFPGARDSRLRRRAGPFHLYSFRRPDSVCREAILGMRMGNGSSDVVIVGGGVIGLSLAYQLALQKVSVTVLERGQIGQEASTAGAGILAPQAEMEGMSPLTELCLASKGLYVDFVQEMISKTGIDIEFSQSGLLYVGFSGEEQ